MELRPWYHLVVLCVLHPWTHGFSLGTSSAANDSRISLLKQAKHLIVKERDANAAFAVLAEVYQQDPNTVGLLGLLESCLRLKIERDPKYSDQDRFGLASLLVDQERYEEAIVELQHVVDHSALSERAFCLLYQCKAAICDWDTREQDDEQLLASLRLDERIASADYIDVPAVHPFEALKWPCISMQDAAKIAQLYARRAVTLQGLDYHMPSTVLSRKRRTVTLSSTCVPVPSSLSSFPDRPLKLGYLSPDFTSTHPMAFLMQSVFQHHDKSIEVHIFSLSDRCPEAPNVFCHLLELQANKSAQQLAEEIRTTHEIDVLIDLCGYTGTSLVAEIMAHRPARMFQLGHLGFPGPTGAPYIDYLICDATVVPSDQRHLYTEGLIYMPKSYFSNSHASATIQTSASSSSSSSTTLTRSMVGLPEDAFVFCCHSRSDKLDPDIMHLWASVILKLRHEHDIPAILWLLRSGPAMEMNIRTKYFWENNSKYKKNGNDNKKKNVDDNVVDDDDDLWKDAVVFCDIVSRPMHLERLKLANVFLDTPSYNAHTVGCDTLFAGTPMITLLLPTTSTSSTTTTETTEGTATTTTTTETTTLHDKLLLHKNKSNYYSRHYSNKWSSRVGASLLRAAGKEEWIAKSMTEYGTLMTQMAILYKEEQEQRNNNVSLRKSGTSIRIDNYEKEEENENADAIATATTRTTTSTIESRRSRSIQESSLFDTQSWVKNLDRALLYLANAYWEQQQEPQEQQQQKTQHVRFIDDVILFDE